MEKYFAIVACFIFLGSQAVPVGAESECFAEGERSALMKAGDWGDCGPNKIGVIIYFGCGNRVTPDDTGNFVIKKLNERLRHSMSLVP